MSKIEVIERQIESLSPRELEEDAATGKLDALADEALGEHRDGNSTTL